MVKIKKIYSIVIVLFIFFCLSSCLLGPIAVDVDEKYDGLSIGFTYEDEHFIHYLLSAVRSNQTEFNINDVTLDCFYGWYTKPPKHYYQSGSREPVCVALYFFNMRDERILKFNNYQNVENMYFLKEISIEEFSTESYNTINSPKKGKTFEQSDSFTIPKEFFVEPGGVIEFTLLNISWNPESNEYVSIGGWGSSHIQYRFIDEETVRLYK